MTERYTTLSKRLEDLESHLTTLFSFTPDNPAPAAFVDDLGSKLAFLARLFDAEAASQPSKPPHLAHISRRFDKLVRDFRAWLDGVAVRSDDAGSGKAEAFEPEGTEVVEYHAETASLRGCHEEEEEQFSDCLGAGIAEDKAGLAVPRGRNRRVGVVKVVGFVCSMVVVVMVMVMVFGWSEYASRDEKFERFLVPT